MIKKFFKGFVYAGQGIWSAVKAERNLRFHICAAFYVLLLSLFYPFGAAEYSILFLSIGGVMAMELMNSAIERAVDTPDPAHWLTAGGAKDMAAGGVLVFSLAAAASGVALFCKKTQLKAMLAWFIARPLALLALAATLPCAYWFVFKFKMKG